MKSLIPWKNKQENAAPSLWGDDWFDRFDENPFGLLTAPFSTVGMARMPRVDVTEDKKDVSVRAELPGMSEKDVTLTWLDGVLRIRGEKQHEHNEEKKGRRYSECSYGYFSRDIPLGNGVDWNSAKAKFKNGVLTVKLPKTENSRKTIEIHVK